MPLKLQGGCFCGNVRYVATSVFDSGYCHCTICRRFAGTSALAWFSVPEHEFALVAGEPKGFRSSEHFTRFFCAVCGTHIYGRDSRIPSPRVGFGLVSIGIGTLDNPELVPPQLHQWWANRVSWFTEFEDLPRFEDGKLTHPSTRVAHEP